MEMQTKWIRPAEDLGDVVPLFTRSFQVNTKLRQAYLTITGLGVYEARINGKRVGAFVLAPGWTVYPKRLQVQKYDVTQLLRESAENEIRVLLGKGWYRSRMAGWEERALRGASQGIPAGLWACLEITYDEDVTERIPTDERWMSGPSKVRFSEIYDGEIYDAGFVPLPEETVPAVVFAGPDGTLIQQEGEQIAERERLAAARIFHTPAGETVVDFGQEITGYVQVTVRAAQGDVVDLSFAEVLDAEGNFYNENYRSAKCRYHYICREGEQTYHPLLTFYGFRYVRINAFPGGVDQAKREQFLAIALYSDMEQTGFLTTKDPLVNQLISNALWSQRCNFLDVPTDCPQRDERLGWTGDIQVFAKTACYNYDSERFLRKWLRDLAADQAVDGGVGVVIPNLLTQFAPSAAWGDAAAIVPWEVYLAYGDIGVLRDQFASMKAWVDYITNTTTTKNLWTGGTHFADWLGLDAPSGSYQGSSRADLIATAFYARSAQLVGKAGALLGEDVREYQALHKAIKEAFQKAFPVYETQTECVLAAHFQLAKDPQGAADQLEGMIREAGLQLRTGFVGTPYLLHVLSDYGHAQTAYDLLLRREYPSWLYAVEKGATTIWEHWDSIREDGSFWSPDMNSFNHYAYGAVLDWLYGVAAGIKPLEQAPGYAKAEIAPVPDRRLGRLEARFQSRRGLFISKWEYLENQVRYEITIPVKSRITIGDQTQWYSPGSYVFILDLTDEKMPEGPACREGGKYHILTGDDMTEADLPRVMALDELCYDDAYKGALENMQARFAKNPRSFVCVMEGERLAGYINFFPVIPALWEEIVETGMVIRDDDIAPEEVADYIKGEENRLFIISVVVHPDDRADGAVIRRLTDAWVAYLNRLQEEGFPIGAISGVAVSEGGKKFLRSRMFHQVREIEQHNLVYTCEGDYLEKLLENELYFKTHKDDVYLLVPFAENSMNPKTQQLFDRRGELALQPVEPGPFSEGQGLLEGIGSRDFVHLMELLNDCIRYECSNDVSKELKRFFLGQFLLVHTLDDYPEDSGEGIVRGEERVFISLLAHRPSHMYVVMLLVPDCKYDTSQLEDQLFQGYLKIRREPEANTSLQERIAGGYLDSRGKPIYMDLHRYLEETYGLLPCGPGKALTCMSCKPAASGEFLNILAGEAFFSMRQNFHIDHPGLRTQASENLAIYDYYEAYMSEKVIAFIFRDFEKLTGVEDAENWSTPAHFAARCELTATYVFIMELVMFQNTALNKMTMKVSNALAQDGDVSYDYMNDLYRDYARSAKFWQNENFQYLGTQKEASQIRRAFGNDDVRETYQELQSFLEDMINLQSAQDERRTGTMINVIATILAVMQVQSFVVGILKDFYEKFGIPVRQADQSFTTVLVGGSILFLLIWFILLRKRRYERRYKIRQHYKQVVESAEETAGDGQTARGSREGIPPRVKDREVGRHG